MPADLIVYAVVAAGLIFWLRSVLGERDEDDSQKPNPYKAAAEHIEKQSGNNMSQQGEKATSEEQISDLAAHPTSTLSIDNKTAENGLLDISKATRGAFDVIFFLEAAQEAFVIIVESFASGDRETLKNLLTEDVYKAFSQALDEREARKETLFTEIQAVRRSEVIEARLKDKTAFVTVRFTADEISVTRDENEKILSGNPDKATQMKDVWTFSRDIKSQDLRWLVCETRSDLEDDNETIPNSH